MEQRPPVKPVLPPMPPLKPVPKPPYKAQPYPPQYPAQPYHPPYQAPQKQQIAVPCDPKMLHHMYRHMKMCHRYETHMLRMYMKWCKEQWRYRRQRRYDPCESSSYRRESSSHHHDPSCGC